ncbi:MAG: hypothetical protein Q9160_008308 [Pyrenula sp. 1 TL-2023]
MPSTRAKTTDESAKRTTALLNQMAIGHKRAAPDTVPKLPKKVRVIQNSNENNGEPSKIGPSVKQGSKGLNRPKKVLRSTSRPGKGENLFDLPTEDPTKAAEARPAKQKPSTTVHNLRSRNPPGGSQPTKKSSPKQRGRPRKSQIDVKSHSKPISSAPSLPPSSGTGNKAAAEKATAVDEGYGSSNTIDCSLQEQTNTAIDESPSSATVRNNASGTETPDARNAPSTPQDDGEENRADNAEDSESSVADEADLSSDNAEKTDILEEFGIEEAAKLLQCASQWSELLNAAQEARKCHGPRIENETLKRLHFLTKVRGEKGPSSQDSRQHTADVTETIDQIKKHCREIKIEVQTNQTIKSGLGIEVYNRTIVSLIRLAAKMLRHGFRDDGSLSLSSLQELVDVLHCSRNLLQVIYNMKPRPLEKTGEPTPPKMVLKSSLNDLIRAYDDYLSQVRNEEAARTREAQIKANRAERRAQERRKEEDTRRLAQQRRDELAQEIAQIQSEDPWMFRLGSSKYVNKTNRVANSTQISTLQPPVLINSNREAEYDECFEIPAALLSSPSVNSESPRTILSQANARPSTPSSARDSSPDGILAEFTSPQGPHHHHYHGRIPSRPKTKPPTSSALDPDPQPWESHELEALIDGLRRFSGPSRYFEIATCYSMEEGRPLRYRDMDAITQKAMWLKKTWRDDEVMTAKHGLPAWLMTV